MLRSRLWLAMSVAVISITACAPAGAADATSARAIFPPTTSPHVINVTPDSAKGWTPSVELERQAQAALADFLAALDNGRASEAYATLTEGNKRDQTPGDFSKGLSKFNSLAGAALERRVTYITWTKDPAQAPAPGAYVAFDLTSHFAKVDRHCGYIVLYQPPAGGAFQVARREDTFIDDATARGIEQKQSKAGLEKVWADLSSHCPNYKAPISEEPSSTIGYKTVAEALADLRARRGVAITNEHGWTIATDAAAKTLWSFAPVGHPAYPSAVKREVVSKDGVTTAEMKVHCEAGKEACDDLVRAFTELNNKAMNSAGGPH